MASNVTVLVRPPSYPSPLEGEGVGEGEPLHPETKPPGRTGQLNSDASFACASTWNETLASYFPLALPGPAPIPIAPLHRTAETKQETRARAVKLGKMQPCRRSRSVRRQGGRDNNQTADGTPRGHTDATTAQCTSGIGDLGYSCRLVLVRLQRVMQEIFLLLHALSHWHQSSWI